MTSGRTWTVVSVCLGAGSFAISAWALSVLARHSTIAPPGFLRALFVGPPASLLLVVAGFVCALIGLVRAADARALAGIGVCVMAAIPTVMLLILAHGLVMLLL